MFELYIQKGGTNLTEMTDAPHKFDYNNIPFKQQNTEILPNGELTEVTLNYFMVAIRK